MQKFVIVKVSAILVFLIASNLNSQELPPHDHKAMEAEKTPELGLHGGHKLSYTPAGLMLPHFHSDGGWMAEYMYMGMNMNSIYSGSGKKDPYGVLYGTNVPYQVVLGSSGHNHGTAGSGVDPFPNFTPQTLNFTPYRYMSTPVKMIMEMHMASLMKSVSDNITLTFLLPYSVNSMEMLSSDLEKTTMTTKGVGDISFLMDWKVYQKGENTFFVRFGIGLPTGSINEKKFMPMMDKVKVPYNMQLGSGSVSSYVGLGYFYDSTKVSAGFFTQGIFRNGTNPSGFKMGNKFENSIWIAYELFEWFIPSLRIAYHLWENVQGSDPAMNPYMDPQNDPNLQGGRRIDLLIGGTVRNPRWRNLRMGFEVGKAVYQNLNGPQMGVDSILNFKVQLMF